MGCGTDTVLPDATSRDAVATDGTIDGAMPADDVVGTGFDALGSDRDLDDREPGSVDGTATDRPTVDTSWDGASPVDATADAPQDALSLDAVSLADAGTRDALTIDLGVADAPRDSAAADLGTVDVGRDSAPGDLGVTDVPRDVANDLGAADIPHDGTVPDRPCTSAAPSVSVTAPASAEAIETCTTSGVPVYFDFVASVTAAVPVVSVDARWVTPDGAEAPPPATLHAAPYVFRRQVGGPSSGAPALSVFGIRGDWRVEFSVLDACGRRASASRTFSLTYATRRCPNP